MCIRDSSRAACHCPLAPPVVSTTPGGGMRAAPRQPPPQQMTRLLLWRPGGPSVLATRGSQRRPPQSST
eukprot:2471109-Prymnesium_polylepis.1